MSASVAKRYYACGPCAKQFGDHGSFASHGSTEHPDCPITTTYRIEGEPLAEAKAALGPVVPRDASTILALAAEVVTRELEAGNSSVLGDASKVAQRMQIQEKEQRERGKRLTDAEKVESVPDWSRTLSLDLQKRLVHVVTQALNATAHERRGAAANE